ncbi:MAG: FHA domain-containing protein [Ktedonobacteraceae bacterium]|nr:FHA domain-containing protein [Ktedonobacteraceae bacterium]
MEAALNGPSGRTTLGPGPVSIGRISDNQVVVNDPKASARHAEIRPEGQGYTISDLGSTNGTFVNERQLDRNVPRLLSTNDRIRIGDTIFTYEAQNAPQVASTAYGGPGQGGYDASSQAYQPTIAATPPDYNYPVQQVQPAYGQPAPPQVQPAYGQPAPPQVQPVQPAYEAYGQPAQPQVQPAYGQPAPPAYEAYGQPAQIPSQPSYGASSYAPPPPQAVYASAPSYPPAAPGIYSQPPQQMPQFPQQVSRKKSRRGLMIASILVVLLLIGGGIAAFVFLSMPTPAKALDKFCTSLKGGDYQSAYSGLSAKLQSKAPEPVFAAIVGKVDNCSYSAVNQVNTSATTNLTLTGAGHTGSDAVTLVQDSSGTWKIDDDPNLTALPKALDSYCSALKGGDYQSAYNQLTSAYQGKISKALFSAFLPGVSACSYTISNVSAGNATATIVLAYNQGQAETDTTSLVQNSTAWQVDALSTLSTPTKSLTLFYNSLKNKAYAVAYELLSSSVQKQFGGATAFGNSIDQVFATNGGITSVQISNVQQSGSTTASGTNVLTYGNGKIETDSDTMINENSVWKVVSIKTV